MTEKNSKLDKHRAAEIRAKAYMILVICDEIYEGHTHFRDPDFLIAREAAEIRSLFSITDDEIYEGSTISKERI